MSNQTPLQATIVTAAKPDPCGNLIQLTLFDAAGAPRVVPAQAAAQADSVAADVATLKTDFNALLAKLRTAKVIG